MTEAGEEMGGRGSSVDVGEEEGEAEVDERIQLTFCWTRESVDSIDRSLCLAFVR